MKAFSAGRLHALIPVIALLGGILLAMRAEAAVPAFHRGVNLSHWFQFSGGQPVRHEDLVTIRASGFDHVRIPFDPELLGWNPAEGPVVPKIAQLRSGVEMALAVGLDVMLDLHLDETTLKSIEGRRQSEAALADLWAIVARRFADLPSEHLAFELLNEPQYYEWSNYRWAEVQQRLASAVRANAPKHLIIATGRKGSSPEGLAELMPLSDNNVAYAFHFYLPYIFTHQGASWMTHDGSTAAWAVKGVPYPPITSTASIIAAIPDSNHRKRAEKEIAEYRGQSWGVERVRHLIQPAIAWATAHHTRVICNEFGVLRTYADPQSRYRWLRDVRTTMENSGFGWTVWDFSDAFGITKSVGQKTQTKREIEPAALEAFNLSR
jgi:endoglucanase